MSKESKKERLRRERLEAERQARSAEQRSKVMKLVGAIGVAALLLIAVLIVVSQSGSSERETSTDDLLGGLQQEGTVLGDPAAETVLVEFGDLQCPHCRDFSQDVMPEIIEGPVRDGTVRVEFRNWPILGAGSVFAAQGALAAAEQGRYWEFIDVFFAEPGRQVNINTLREVAEEAGVPDLEQWQADTEDTARWEDQIIATNREARDLNFSGTPAFALQVGDGDLQAIEMPASAEDVEAAVKEAS